MNKLILFSGGLDSTELAWKALNDGHTVHLLHIIYNHPARHMESLAADVLTNKLLKYFPNKVKLSSVIAPIISKNMYIGSCTPGPRVVPNRNAIFLNIAINFAVSNNITEIEYGAVLDDQSDYLDCRPEFIKKMNAIASDWGVFITAPLIGSTKYETMKSIPDEIYNSVWSCYEPLDEKPCGKCNSCRVHPCVT